MKRSIFVAALALTPSLLFAQATSPAPTSTQAVLQARAAVPADIMSADPKNTTPSASRVSTGIVAPKLLNSVSLKSLPGNHDRILANDVTVVVDLTVDAAGKTGNVAVEKSAGDAIDQEVVAAVRQYRFQAGTLDGQPFALPVRLEVKVERGVQY